jgi:hypothetical protein
MRARADWGGVVLLGEAPTNANVAPIAPDGGVDAGDAGADAAVIMGEGRIEGLPTTEDRARFGGANPDHDCGTLRYVRIEFAGFEFAPARELNGLTLGACGRRTTVDHVQVHMGSDDGVEVFGGTVDMRYVVISRAADDGFDWDNGYRGRVQFLVVQQDVDPLNANHGFEGDNSELAPSWDATPRSLPTIYNATLVGSGAAPVAGDRDPELGMLIRRGSRAVIRNTIVMNFPAGALNVQSAQSAAGAASGELVVENSIFYNLGAGGEAYFPAETGAGDDEGFVEATFFNAGERRNIFGMSPLLTRPTDLVNPSFVPAARSPTATGAAAAPPGDFFDPLANFIGAIAPGGPDWTQGWTAFPNN